MKNKKLAWLKNNKWLTILLLFFLNLLSRFPMQFLYAIATVMAFLLHRVFRYRLSIVRKNLKNSFPEKSVKERRIIEHKFYHSFAQILMEVIKFRSMKPEELKQRARYTPSSIVLMDRFYNQGKSVLIVMGHMGNWEMAGSAFPLYNKHQILTAYRPLRNKTFDRDTLRIRQRTGNWLATMRNLPREMLRNRKNIMATALIADQTPPKENAFWVSFLNQETAFFKGTEVLSKKFNTPLIWGKVHRIKKGFYQIDLQLITENPQTYERDGELTRLFVSYLERDIDEQPESWLWSHRRWKHQRPEDQPLG